MDKAASLQMIGQLRALLNDWDPIGVRGHEDEDWPSDEYDCLHGLVLGSLRKGDSIDETARLLDHEFREHLGLLLKIESWRSTAERLHAGTETEGMTPGRPSPSCQNYGRFGRRTRRANGS